jgi:hypothetical protein
MPHLLAAKKHKGRKKETQKDVYSHGHRRTDTERETSLYAKLSLSN